MALAPQHCLRFDDQDPLVPTSASESQEGRSHLHKGHCFQLFPFLGTLHSDRHSFVSALRWEGRIAYNPGNARTVSMDKPGNVCVVNDLLKCLPVGGYWFWHLVSGSQWKTDMSNGATWRVFKPVNPTTQRLTELSGSIAVSPSFLDVSSMELGQRSKVYPFF